LPVVIAVVNSKGGVGKTTVAVHLAASLASPRRRVLLVDLDSQATASLYCGVSRNQLRPSTASVLLEKYPILKAIRHTEHPQVDLLTGALELANADVALAGVRGRELALQRTLERAGEHYELVVIDCPPSMSLLGVNAIVAADWVIVPVAPEPLAVGALGALLASVDRVRARMHAHSRLLGILITLVDARRSIHAAMVDRIRTEFRDKVFHTELRWTSALAAGPTARGLRPAATGAPGSDPFHRLAGEILQRIPALRH